MRADSIHHLPSDVERFLYSELGLPALALPRGLPTVLVLAVKTTITGTWWNAARIPPVSLTGQGSAASFSRRGLQNPIRFGIFRRQGSEQIP